MLHLICSIPYALFLLMPSLIACLLFFPFLPSFLHLSPPTSLSQELPELQLLPLHLCFLNINLPQCLGTFGNRIFIDSICHSGNRFRLFLGDGKWGSYVHFRYTCQFLDTPSERWVGMAGNFQVAGGMCYADWGRKLRILCKMSFYLDLQFGEAWVKSGHTGIFTDM